MSVEGILISGLDTFSGTPSAGDYLVIDNGTNTKKISAPSLLENAKGEDVISFADPDTDGNIVITLL